MIGKSKTISTSKIKNIIEIKKNRKENGTREDLLGSNPHSNAVIFSRSHKDFLDKTIEMSIIILAKNIINKPINNIKLIIYINVILILIIGSYEYFIYYTN